MKNWTSREDASGDSEDGEDDELPCVIGESEGDGILDFFIHNSDLRATDCIKILVVQIRQKQNYR